ncbi:hypothetical protein M378DRAFT_16393 [Amanita muscaria Koide BX008]|uniref:Uncharacterized protein n=1 Tax=Amanita muscaria (strain Koide BX008) TaxID=946122 RepID=A0A0C2WLX5_AMAMK|nr:hypothetical protein M378DRAFT_16393 [Amanita muscaria Koide BX008]
MAGHSSLTPSCLLPNLLPVEPTLSFCCCRLFLHDIVFTDCDRHYHRPAYGLPSVGLWKTTTFLKELYIESDFEAAQKALKVDFLDNARYLIDISDWSEHLNLSRDEDEKWAMDLSEKHVWECQH